MRNLSARAVGAGGIVNRRSFFARLVGGAAAFLGLRAARAAEPESHSVGECDRPLCQTCFPMRECHYDIDDGPTIADCKARFETCRVEWPCHHVFGSERCGAIKSGPHDECGGTLSECRERGNAHHFGGIPVCELPPDCELWDAARNGRP